MLYMLKLLWALHKNLGTKRLENDVISFTEL